MLFSNQNKTKSQNYIIVVLGLLGMLEVFICQHFLGQQVALGF